MAATTAQNQRGLKFPDFAPALVSAFVNGRDLPARARHTQRKDRRTPKVIGVVITTLIALISGNKLLPQTHASLVSKPALHFHTTSRAGVASAIASAMHARVTTDGGGRFMVDSVACQRSGAGGRSSTRDGTAKRSAQ
jgi:hypothetical protein